MVKHVVVLKGGPSAEREVSLVSGRECAKALAEIGYKVTEIDVTASLAEDLVRIKPDVVFNALHGRWGEDGCVQGLLELLKIPYTHSGVLASSIAMDKPMAKRVFASIGIRCPEGRVVTREEMLAGDPMPRPYVVKPSNEGSSVGVKICFENDNFFFTPENWTYGETVLVERYIHGRELTVAVLRGKALAVTELQVKSGFFDYENKYTAGKTVHICPADLPKDVAQAAMRMAVEAHNILGCRGISRSDLRYDEAWPGERGLYLLEINTQPGMTPVSLSPEQAKHAGIPFTSLMQMLIEDATLGA